MGDPVAMRMIERFSCLGAECPATCCAGWRVPLVADEAAQIAAMQPDAVDLTARALRMDARGQCALLDAGWCRLHREHGEPALPWACATFPRRATAWPDRVETTLTLACPEVARLLATEPDPLAAVPWPIARLPRPEGERPALDRTPDALIAGRAWMRLGAGELQRGSGSLAARMFRVAALVHLDRDGGVDAPRRWSARLTDPAWRAAREDALAALEVPLPTALAWLDGLVTPWAAKRGSGLRALWTSVRGAGLARRADALQARARAWPRGPRAFFVRHAAHHLLHHDPGDDLVAAAQRWMLHTAVVRAAVWLHPEAPEVDDPDAWATVAADAAWRVARELDHARTDLADPWRDAAPLRTLAALALPLAIGADGG